MHSDEYFWSPCLLSANILAFDRTHAPPVRLYCHTQEHRIARSWLLCLFGHFALPSSHQLFRLLSWAYSWVPAWLQLNLTPHFWSRHGLSARGCGWPVKGGVQVEWTTNTCKSVHYWLITPSAWSEMPATGQPRFTTSVFRVFYVTTSSDTTVSCWDKWATSDLPSQHIDTKSLHTYIWTMFILIAIFSVLTPTLNIGHSKISASWTAWHSWWLATSLTFQEYIEHSNIWRQ